jgi:two-component system, sporulation sensor kinase E
MNSSFFDKLLDRLDRVGPDQVQSILVRLLREKGFLEKVFQSLQEGVIMLTTDGVATFVNRAALSFFGLDHADQANGRLLNEIIPGLLWDDLITADNHTVSRDLEIFYPTNRFLNLYVSPINDEGESPSPEDDQVLGYVLLIRDLTQTRRLTEEKIESERLNALTLLAAGVAHELGNPLNSLNIHLQVLERKLRKSDPTTYSAVKDQIDVARGEVNRLDMIIAQFLSAVRPSRPQLEPEDLNSLIQEVTRFLRPEIEDRKISLTLELRDDLPLLRVDAGQMKQAFYNLIKNACQATAIAGEVTLRTDMSDEEVTIRIQDHGSGISPEHLGQMFEPFRTTKKSGTGLGLLIVRRIIREHGGEIQIASTEGIGTQVTLHLPLGPKRIRLLKAQAE